VFNEDCGATGFSCINATCHPTCSQDGECGRGESCSRGVCRADFGPVRQCIGSCSQYMACIRGVCRTPCSAPINCQDEAMSECSEGFCRFSSEVKATCERASDCSAPNDACVDGTCVRLGQ
jgi:hypothetical protein